MAVCSARASALAIFGVTNAGLDIGLVAVVQQRDRALADRAPPLRLLPRRLSAIHFIEHISDGRLVLFRAFRSNRATKTAIRFALLGGFCASVL